MLGHLTERALAQAQPVLPAAVGLRLRGEPQLLHDRGQLRDGLLSGQLLVRRRLLGEVGAPLAPGLLRGPARLRHGPGDQAGEHLRQQPVASPPGGAAGDRPVADPGPAGRLPVFCLADGQARLHQCLQVESCRVRVQPHPLRDLPDAERAVGGAQHV